MLLRGCRGERSLNIVESSQYLRFVKRNQDRVLIVGRWLAVACAAFPAVALYDYVLAPEIDHRLDADAHSRLKHRSDSASPEIRDFRILMHTRSYAMPTHLTNHTVVVVFAISLHGVGDVSDSLSGLGYGYALVETPW